MSEAAQAAPPKRDINALLQGAAKQPGPRVMTQAEADQIKTQAANAVSIDEVQGFFAFNRARLAELTPTGFNVDRLLAQAMNALQENWGLRRCPIGSLFGALIKCAQVGLEPNTPDQHAYLIPVKGRRKVDGTWHDIMEVQLRFGYRGFIELAYRSGWVKLFKTVAAHQHDDFVPYEGTDQRIHHIPRMTGRGEMIAVYAACLLKTDCWLFEVMPREEVERVRNDNSDAYAYALHKGGDTPWITDFVEMARKTAVRRLYKSLPRTPAMSLAVSLDQDAFDGRSQRLARVIDEKAEAPDDDAEQSAQDHEESAGAGEAQVRQQAEQQTGNAEASAKGEADEDMPAWVTEEIREPDPAPQNGGHRGKPAKPADKPRQAALADDWGVME